MKQSPAAVGWWALSGRKHRKVPPAPSCTSPTCSIGALPTSQQSPAMLLAPRALGWELHQGLPSSALLVVAECLSCLNPPWCSQEGSHVSVTLPIPATGALDNADTQEQKHCRGLYVLVYNTSAGTVWLMFNLSAPEAQTFPDACRDPCLLLQWHFITQESHVGKAISRGTCIHSESHTYASCTLAWRVREIHLPRRFICCMQVRGSCLVH